MSALNVTLSTPANKKFLIQRVRLTNSTNDLAVNLKFLLNMFVTKKGALMRLFLCTGSTVYRKEPRMAVRICSWMSGIAQGARDGGAHMPWKGSILQQARKAIRIGLTLLLIQAALVNTALADTACPATQFDKKSRVLYTHDGDTLHLKDGRKVRLIGINTPELGRDNNAAEPFANEAKAALKSLFKNDKSISLIYGKVKKDHYQRLLAHAFTSDGRNIQALLLANGFARVIAFPPNTQFTACYLEQERKARCSKTGPMENGDNSSGKIARQIKHWFPADRRPA